MKKSGPHVFAWMASVCLLLSLVAAVCVGGQTRQWSWGPCLPFLGLALLFSIPVAWAGRFRLSPWVTGIALVTAAWFSWRAWMSPVREIGTSDFLLLLITAGGAAVASVLFTSRRAVSPFLWGLCALIAASFVVTVIQSNDPGFAPLLRARPYSFPSGFFGHYNECANFFIGGSLLLGAFAARSNHGLITRIIWGMVSLLGATGVYLTHSRGGILALVAGLFIGLLFLLLSLRRSKWFGMTLIATTVIIIISVAFLASGWKKAQQVRGIDVAKADGYSLANNVMENPIRLTFLEIAAEAVMEAPWSGSGSGSFSWNVYRFWDSAAHGNMYARPEVVHNELMQSATDYGILGAGLLLTLLTILSINASVHTLLPGAETKHLFPAIAGGMAGMAGMIVQSCFSAVFHLSPGALLFGICLGAVSVGSQSTVSQPRKRGPMMIILLPMAAAAVVALIMALPRVRMTTELWSVYFKGGPAPPSWAIARRLDEASRILPLPSTLTELGMVLFRISRSDDPLAKEAEEKAIEAFRASVSGNPKNPTTSLNLANLLGNSGQFGEAEVEYRRTIVLQGTAEGLFWGHFRLAEHFLKRGIDAMNAQKPQEAIGLFEIALQEISESEKLAHWLIQGTYEGSILRYDVNENFGLALERTGDFEGALQCYATAAKILPKANVHIGRILETLARTHWRERRPSQALWTFQNAMEHLKRAPDLPRGVTSDDLSRRMNEIEETMKFLREAGIQPIER